MDIRKREKLRETCKGKERQEVIKKKQTYAETVVQRLLPDLTSTAHDSEAQEETGDNPGCIAEENKLCVSSRIEKTREWGRQGFQGKSLSPQHAW